MAIQTAARISRRKEVDGADAVGCSPFDSVVYQWYTVSDSENERQAERGTLHVLLLLMHGHPRGSEE